MDGRMMKVTDKIINYHYPDDINEDVEIDYPYIYVSFDLT